MTSLAEHPISRAKKKKASTRRRVLKAQDNFEATNVYSVANIRQTFQSSAALCQDSDDEENVEQFQQKLNSRMKHPKPSKNMKKKPNFINISDDEDNCVTPKKLKSKNSLAPSPSPPPPPPLEWEEPRSKRTETTVRNLDKAYYNAVSTQHAVTPTPRGEILSDVDLDNSFELTRNRQEITVKVRTKHGLKRYQLGMDEPLIKIVISLAEDENLDVNRVSLTRCADQLNEDDTPRTLNLQVTDILDSVVIDPSSVPLEDLSDLIPEEDKVDIKFQGQEKKSVFTMRIPRDETLKRALEAYSEFISVSMKRLKFTFDGEIVSSVDTPDYLDMEEQGTIDVVIR